MRVGRTDGWTDGRVCLESGSDVSGDGDDGPPQSESKGEGAATDSEISINSSASGTQSPSSSSIREAREFSTSWTAIQRLDYHGGDPPRLPLRMSNILKRYWRNDIWTTVLVDPGDLTGDIPALNGPSE